MTSPADIPQQDEVLKGLMERFKKAPDSNAFVELASALLSRGHASEALRVAEHGLGLRPSMVDGRIERASALLALGRPRMAYVELRRALAIHPQNRRGMRLLGKAYKDAGAPARAAELLARRSLNEEEPPAPPPPPAEEPPPAKWPAAEVPALFSALTKDLGLGGAVPKRQAPPRVEVTQIMRRKRLPRAPRSKSELGSIDGPIVDTTQPGHLEIQEDEPAPVQTSNVPNPLFTGDLALGLQDDEPLFQENMPFAIRPVAQDTGDLVSDGSDTIVEDIAESPEPFKPVQGPGPVAPMPGLEEATADKAATLTDDLRMQQSLRKPDPRSETVPLGGGIDGVPTGEMPSPAGRTSPGVPNVPTATADLPPVVEKNRSFTPGRLSVVDAPTPMSRILLAGLAAVLMVGFLVGLGWLGQDRLQLWLDPVPQDSAAAANTSAP